MNIRTQFIITFVSVALFVLIFFGAVTYRIALFSETENELAFFKTLTQEVATNIGNDLGSDPSLAQLRRVVNSYSKKSLLVSAVDADGEFIYPESADGTTQDYDKKYPWEKILKGEPKENHIDINNRHLLWRVQSVPSSRYKLILLGDFPEIEAFNPLKTLGARIIIAGLISIWVSVWVALMIATAIIKRLDKQNAILIHQETHDALTGLANRTLLNNRLKEYIDEHQNDEQFFSLLIMDLNQFKEINDTLGHDVGDRLLQAVGERLQQGLRGDDTIARLGGDEFAVFLPGIGAEVASQCAVRILEAIGEPFHMNHFDITVSTSIGIAVYPEHGKDAASLIRRADVAMYQAKQSNSGFVVYAPKHDSNNLRRLTLLTDLNRAIERNQLILYYQPRVDIPTRKIVSVEGLLRWKHPQHGFVPPDEFIPLAEQGGFIKPLTLWVLNEALRQQHAWKQKGIELNVSVNLSAKNLQDSKLPSQIAKLLATWDISAERLELEITESAIMFDPNKAMHILTMIHNMGVQISIDDFGTGHSSLSYLKRLPARTLKIDKSFVIDMCVNENDAIIVRATIDLAHNLGLDVVAEGVEDRDTLDLLEILGCDTAQGCYFSKPLPEKELMASFIPSNVFPIGKKQMTS